LEPDVVLLTCSALESPPLPTVPANTSRTLLEVLVEVESRSLQSARVLWLVLVQLLLLQVLLELARLSRIQLVGSVEEVLRSLHSVRMVWFVLHQLLLVQEFQELANVLLPPLLLHKLRSTLELHLLWLLSLLPWLPLLSS
ncbi:hypothetical protein HDU99_007551, partial [Rhizoclosmatium hyalinum]